MGPETVSRLVLALPEERWDVPTHLGRFSPREVVWHLASWEPVMRGRLEAALKLESPSVENWDEEAHAVIHRYSELEMQEGLDKYRRERAFTSSLAEQISRDNEGRVYVHPILGAFTLADGLSLLTAHDMYHVAQLTEFLLRR
jgi:uncharacterized damage-inducible protein DinB